jgi:hypothetical protein
MIDPSDETLIALADWPERLPRRRGGRKAHRSTIHRWCSVGCRGVVVEVVQVASTKCASPAAMCRFFAAVAAAAPANPQPARTPRQRQRDIDRADRELDAAGA